MRDGILKLFIICMLFVSMEGVAKSVDETSFHQTHHSHADGAENLWFPVSDGGDHESDADSCQHFCHAHAVALTTQFSLPSFPKLHHGVPAIAVRTNTRGASPPTPPPNI